MALCRVWCIYCATRINFNSLKTPRARIGKINKNGIAAKRSTMKNVFKYCFLFSLILSCCDTSVCGNKQLTKISIVNTTVISQQKILRQTPGDIFITMLSGIQIARKIVQTVIINCQLLRYKVFIGITNKKAIIIFQLFFNSQI